MKQYSSKFSYIAVSLIMGAIIISFVLTGFQGFGGNANQVAEVEGTPITKQEFNQALQFNIDQYSKMFGGKALTQKQIRDMRIKEMTLSQLVNRKHFLNFASQLGFSAGKQGIKNEVKEIKAFQTAGKFDVNKYKMILGANRLSPAQFEKDIINQVKTKKLGELTSSLSPSKVYAEELYRAQNLTLKSLAVSFNKEAMTEYISVPQTEITAFVNDQKNEKLLAGLYNSYEQEQKMKKGKVKKFSLAKNDLAKKHLQKTQRKKLTDFNNNLKKEIESALSKNNVKKLNQLKKRYKINFEKAFELTPLKKSFAGVSFDENKILNIFKTKDYNIVLNADSAMNVAFIKPISLEEKKLIPTDIKKEIQSIAQRSARKLERDIIKYKDSTSKSSSRKATL